MRLLLGLPVVGSVLVCAASAGAQETLPAPAGGGSAERPSDSPSPSAAPAIPATSVSPAKQFPAIGGHFGFAVPIVTVGGSNTVIGSDFVTVGLTPGVTVHLDEKWAIDFEFIAFNEMKNTPASTTFIVDPGVLRKFDGFVAGLRVATQVGAPTNVGIVPIVVVPIKISDKLVYFFEADVPLFLRDNGQKPEGTATFLFQSGFGF